MYAIPPSKNSPVAYKCLFCSAVSCSTAYTICSPKHLLHMQYHVNSVVKHCLKINQLCMQ